jgi:hypothetical protein
MNQKTGTRILLALFIIAVVLRILSFAGLGVVPESANGFLTGFVIGSAIGLAVAWLVERA